MDGALAEPVVLGHAFDQDVFGGVGGSMVLAQSDEEIVEILPRFGGQEGEHAAEAVFKVVHAGFGPSFLGTWTG